ncbi:alpha-xylosidase [Haloquadratum walsbyi]|jgi:Alpha-glucosidases, family 31 of glycosyl hydrolases|uniref:Glycosyl hydrolase, family 31 n=1 Tax=Haloquadratum walsbyi J07HQW2 TaxID=1238425 RepID=U1NCP6_9EURY|nr:alpha-xylosidase [Haloquadratum walsbyi]ERG94448.1 MAG: glycosyl hydrolase, family 31 [Haloquadratum walsbyi J07HQW2]
MWLELTDIITTDFDDTFTFQCGVSSVSNEHTTPNREFPLTIRFLDDQTLKILFRPNPEASPTDCSPLSLPYDVYDQHPDVSVNLDDSVIELATGEMSFSINTKTASFSVTHDNKQLIDTDVDVTNNRGELNVPSIGYEETVVENYPLEVTRTGFTTRSYPTESFFGLGEQFSRFEKRGQRITTSVTQAHGVNSSDTYAPIPFFISDRGYGMLVETAADTTFDFGHTTPDVTAIDVESPVLSIVLFVGSSFKDIISSYTRLSGRAPSLPAWTYGVWMSRNSYQTQTEVLDTAAKLRERSVPCDVIHIDPEWMDIDSPEMTFDSESFPDPEEMCTRLDEDGFKLSLWEYPYINTDTDLFQTAQQNGYLMRNHEGRTYIFRRPSHAQTRAGIIDFSNPEAVEWWQDLHRELIDTGVDVFKTDFGEYLPPQTTTDGRRTGTGAKNAYPLVYQQAVAGGFEKTDKPPVLWSRSAWAGAQQYPVHWGGDARSTFDGFRASVRGGLSLVMSGFQFWSCDIGGYKPTPSKILYIRWAQWGLLALSHPRFHGKSPREPWEFGDTAAEIVTKFANLRYRLLPYYISYGCEAASSGIPVMRPMAVEFEDWIDSSMSATQHMVGEEFLLAPVLSEDGSVSITLPPGEWIDYWSKTYYTGPDHQKRTVDASKLPFFIRAGSIIPEYPSTRSHTDGLPTELQYHIYPRQNTQTSAQFTFQHPEIPEAETITAVIDDSHNEVTIKCSEGLPSGSVIIEEIYSLPERITVNETMIEPAAVAHNSDTETLQFDLER